MPRKEVLAIIPARGGSKGLPRKNVLDLGGKPLLAWSVEAAIKCPFVTRVIVSTDDPEIAEVARDSGAEVPFLRPPELATDTALLGKVFGHVLDTLREEDYIPDALVAMYPTSPFRTRHMVDTVVANVLNGYRQALTVRPISSNGIGFLRMDGSGRLVSDFPRAARRDVVSTYYRSYGLLHAVSLSGKYHAHSVSLYQVRNPVHLVDIDTPEDLEEARRIVSAGRHEEVSA